MQRCTHYFTQWNVSRLQLILNATTRFLTAARWFIHCTSSSLQCCCCWTGFKILLSTLEAYPKLAISLRVFLFFFTPFKPQQALRFCCEIFNNLLPIFKMSNDHFVMLHFSTYVYLVTTLFYSVVKHINRKISKWERNIC